MIHVLRTLFYDRVTLSFGFGTMFHSFILVMDSVELSRDIFCFYIMLFD